MINMSFRPCGDCTGCCSGKLAANIYGHEMYDGKPCHFLKRGKCSIYNDRPHSPCRTYQCAWSQHLLDEDMRPDKIGLIVSVQNDEEGQYLTVTKLWDEVPEISYKRVKECAEKLDARIYGL